MIRNKSYETDSNQHDKCLRLIIQHVFTETMCKKDTPYTIILTSSSIVKKKIPFTSKRKIQALIFRFATRTSVLF